MLIYLAMIENEKDQSKFELLYTQYRKLMLKVANDILHDSHYAEDAVHDAFIKIINNLQKINVSECNKTKNLMVIIVRGIAIRYYHKLNDTPVSLDDEQNGLSESSLPSMLKSEYAIAPEDVKEALSEMDKKYADVLLLKYYFGFSGSEIAKLLDITQPTARARLARARQLLFNALHE